jgi:AmpD protein
MQIDPTNGWLDEAERVPSPNCDDRPAGSSPELIVIHNISLPPGQFGGPYIKELFCNQLDPTVHPYFKEIAGMQVSAHVLIRRDGRLLQFVPFNLRAWHAGESCYQGREQCNDFSIGIELEGCDDAPFEDIQYRQLAQVIASLVQAYPDLSAERITGHSDIAPGRKTDPGPLFDWARLRSLIESEVQLV